MYLIDDETAYKDFKDYLQENPKILSVKGNVITTEDFSVEVLEPYEKLLNEVILLKPITATELQDMIEKGNKKVSETMSEKFKVLHEDLVGDIKEGLISMLGNSDTTEGVIENAGYKFKTY